MVKVKPKSEFLSGYFACCPNCNALIAMFSRASSCQKCGTNIELDINEFGYGG